VEDNVIALQFDLSAVGAPAHLTGVTSPVRAQFGDSGIGMHISKLSLVHYRNFANAKFLFNKGTNTVIGENGAGKTNLFRAIRLLLDDTLIRSAYKLDERDFSREIGDWRGHWIIISLEFEEISPEEAIQSLFLHGTGNLAGKPLTKASYNLIFRPRSDVRLKLSKLTAGDQDGLAAIRAEIDVDNYESIFTGKSTADFNDPATYRSIVGDFAAAIFPETMHDSSIGVRLPTLLAVSKEVAFTYVQALRDVVAEFQANRTNPLLTLLKSKSGAVAPAEIDPIIKQVEHLNSSIEKLKDVQQVRSDIIGTIKDAAGEAYSPTSLSIKSDLPQEADRLFQALKLFVGESEDGHEGAIHDLSLGGANLIYLTLKLLEFKYQKSKESFANFLLIEEPEAHIHTHIQKTLFDRIRYSDTQIIYSTHSPQISEVSNVRNMNILGKNGGRVEVFQPWIGLSEPQLIGVQRYLDAVRCNLLFAKSVLLVEGDAEEILIPAMAKAVFGLSLDEMGISLINIRSTGFMNIALLFHNTRIRKRCGIITDLDAAFFDTVVTAEDAPSMVALKHNASASASAGQNRKGLLDAFVAGNPWVRAYYAQYTFEVDFAHAGNQPLLISALPEVYSQAATIADVTNDLSSGELVKYGWRALTIAKGYGKGWFAVLLSKLLTPQTRVPSYILSSLFFVQGEVSRATWAKMFYYRLEVIAQQWPTLVPTVEWMREGVKRYQEGTVSFNEVAEAFKKHFSADIFTNVLLMS